MKFSELSVGDNFSLVEEFQGEFDSFITEATMHCMKSSETQAMTYDANGILIANTWMEFKPNDIVDT